MRFLIVLILMLALCGCKSEDLFADDLEMAKAASLQRNWPLAERLLQRCLRDEKNPERRWQAWQLLLKAVNGKSQEPRTSLELLEAMMEEYPDDSGKMAEILIQMGKNNESLHRYDRAATAWSSYLDLVDIGDAERVEGYRKLAAMQFGQRYFEAAEDSLQQCLALPLPDHDKIYCMLDLADANMARERWEEVADLCQQILDSDPDSGVLGVAGYLRGDALEQMGRLDDALAQFEMARNSYPNPAVMDNRINYLKKTISQKKN